MDDTNNEYVILKDHCTEGEIEKDKCSDVKQKCEIDEKCQLSCDGNVHCICVEEVTKQEYQKTDECISMLNCEDVGICQFSYRNAHCKCVEEFTRQESKKNVDAIILPSAVTDKEEIYLPQNVTNEDPSIYGKWLVFTNSNLKLLDHLWIQLQNLLQTKDLILISSSTGKKSSGFGQIQGVVKCYTCKDINVIKRAGIAIQNILKDDTILDYKTNQASKDNLYRARGNRYITKFMLTVNGKLYKKDKLCRWIQITDTEYQNFQFEEDFFKNYFNWDCSFAKRRQLVSESNLLPSLETRKKMKRFVYPDGKYLKSFTGIWCLFCDVSYADDNGLTELDNAWIKAKALCDENYFRSITCETYALQHQFSESLSRRTIMCEVDFEESMTKSICTERIIKCADKLRERMSYNMPMYFKQYQDIPGSKPEYNLMYLYTDDQEFYEYFDNKWKLMKI